ncbi:enoyl-CoA hydratase/isomerase family protein [Sneathiella limimaris]|uniref:enoyl-CoA hydratase/isomerase family protein n=1 Tax=Sneathiella limimaris TaxID=1964213 RepID=UPI00146B080F|nr:enoyl-CoA hydratase-related protein [Sneathiella limimaris]
MSQLPDAKHLLLEQVGGRLNITFNRPEVRNAINSEMGAEFSAVVDWLADNSDVRVVVLRGAGGHFCAGGDIKERKSMAVTETSGEDPLMARNRQAGLAFNKFENLPQTTISVVEGSAFGGGMGYACLTDITILSKTAKMGMPETTLGVAPAQIAPYVVKRIGLTRARQLALTAERFDGQTAYDYGIGQYLAEPDALDQVTEDVVARVLKCGPMANAATKAIMLRVGTLPAEELISFSAAEFAKLNRSREGVEGQTAFAEKRKPSWQEN